MCRKSILLMALFVLGLAGTLTAGELIKINFQLAGAEVPEGYLPDTGLVFGDRGNGYSYGWSQNMTDQTRDRNNAAAPDQRYDTLIHFMGTGAVWEIELPLGTYRVFIVCGDPSYADSNNQIELEGELLAEDPDGLDSYDEFEFILVVNDGRLTWSEPEGSYVKPCFIEIESSKPLVKATKPDPKDGSILTDTWVNLSWKPGETSVSHDVYFGDNLDDINDGTSETFRGNQLSTSYIVGFPGFPFPEGLIPGTTYYWRIDEVNDAEPNSPWKGDVWNFMIAPRTAYYPDPADGAESVNVNVKLSWTAGFGAKLHYVYFGDNFDDVNNATGGLPQALTTYTPGQLELAKTYYWRVDEFDIIETYKGQVWSFTTEGAVGSPNPANGAVDVKQTPTLSWTPGVYAASHQVYFGADKEAVRNATTASPEYKGIKALGSETYDPGILDSDSTYYWRIDEVNDANPDSPWTGNIWSFTTANFLVVDDFEDYDAGDNQIWYAWKDGLGYGTPGTDSYYPGNGSGSAVGDENTPSYTEETIVHGGSQAMPLFYDNNKQGFFKYSEAELTLTYPRDWTENGVNRLTIWFRGDSANAAEPLYVALNGSAVVTNDNPDAAQVTTWTEWNIDLQAFADQGVNLTNINTIALGLGDKKNPLAGGSGTMYFDDIRLYPPPSP